MDNSVFSACKPYLSHFDKVGAQYNIPPILLASIAMQESKLIVLLVIRSFDRAVLSMLVATACRRRPFNDER